MECYYLIKDTFIAQIFKTFVTTSREFVYYYVIISCKMTKENIFFLCCVFGIVSSKYGYQDLGSQVDCI